ncbi:hypothetical protein ACFSX5_06430 [Devosia albogilva]|uniref:DUF2188 domain-containing protein n=1 Tax=Devosia albogilva TaxID=429726 RepID=A0ABW5QIN7_9HYPH
MTVVSSTVGRPSTCLYIVLKAGEGWWVDREGKAFGPCGTKDDAEGAAFKLIELFGDPERPAEVWSPDDSGKIQLVWRGRVQG